MSARVLRSLGWLVLAVILAAAVLWWIGDGGVFASGTAWIALPIVAAVAASWAALRGLSPVPGRAAGIAVPVLFGAMLLWLWQVLVTGFQVPQILLPAPSQIAARFAASTDTLWVDFVQTFIRSAIPGFLIGSGAGFLTAVAIDRSPFLQRGLLPLGSAVSAMPIVGIAPVMIMWFGFDWHSKAAVVVVMTFFPMLVNALAGLEAAGTMERDLMRSYAASYWQTLWKLRLPGALPFIFNALKLNATLALIGAIVAEFFGTPIYGMGFRISTEVARLNVDMVWATILVAAVAGSASYGLLALVERATTFWHPSMREAER
ncbi:ABC transporter permease [Inquilinus limosus]|uniref:ABC transporter permease n=1 Tax=Inquilinus limosus TaxID=171674 RepID=A0A211ZII6_9PROT|nr:ABC transporter permease [Inquilinus limosus]OWJ65053.1 ABC transporter permease [Inquilinus limosus]